MRYARVLVLAVLALLVSVSSFAGERLSGKVVGVKDGDTIVVLTADKRSFDVRFAQIDAPEKAQPFGKKSKESLSSMVYGKAVDVLVETQDKYGRTVGTVLVAGQDINLEQVRRGMAWVYRQYARDRAYYMAEEDARGARRGLWGDENPTPPWEYRHSKN